MKSRRIHKSGTVFVVKDGTHAIIGNVTSILIGVILPEADCRQISGEYQGAKLTFLVSVEP